MSFDPKLCRNEAEVESKLIVQYLLPELGYAPDSWHQEVAFGNIRLDFLAFASQMLPFSLSDNSPLSLVVEAKGPRENLDKHERKLMRYLRQLRVSFEVLTNAQELRIYQRQGEEVECIFACAGQDISTQLPRIRAIVGRESIQKALKESLTSSELMAEEVQELVDQEKENPSMKVIAVYHNKGGVGKTTVSVNLAAAFSLRGLRVLLIDIDAQANSTFATGLVKFLFDEEDDLRDANVAHLLLSGESNLIPDIVRRSQLFNDPEIDVIPSHITLIEVQEKLNQIAVSRTRLPTKLKQVEHVYDIVIIDTPPSRDLYAQLPMIAADYLIIPSDLKPFANQGLPNVKNFVRDINEYRMSIGKDELKILGVLPSKINTNPKYLANTFPKQKQSVIDKYGLPVFDTIISERVTLSRCADATVTVGDLEIPNPQSIFKYDPNSPSAQEFEVLAKEVLEKMRV
ncbi:AAA family ATPase [Trichothermofontia sp.]